MELQDHTVEDVTEEEALLVRAQRDQAYPIRVLHLSNGMIIIGFVISMMSNCILILRPYNLDILFNETGTNIDQYGFDPYMNQLALFEPNGLDPVIFMLSNVISINVPAPHLKQNYESIIALNALGSVDPEHIQVSKRHYLNNMVH